MLVVEVVLMTRCTYCGVENERGVGPCILCGHQLAGTLVSESTVRRAGLTILVPLLVWLLAHRGLGI